MVTRLSTFESLSLGGVNDEWIELYKWVEILLLLGFGSICILCFYLLYFPFTLYSTSYYKQDGLWLLHLTILLSCIIIIIFLKNLNKNYNINIIFNISSTMTLSYVCT